MTVNHPLDKPINDDVLQEAANWFAVVQDIESSQESQAFKSWLEADESHYHAWQQVTQLSASIQKLQQSPEKPAIGAVLKSQNKPIIGSLLSLLVCVSSVMAWYIWSPSKSSALFTNKQYQTAVGETRSIVLADGSALWLNTNSKVSVRYNADLRQIEILSGEVLVETAADSQYPARSLVVDSQHGRLTALGTRFTVQQSDSHTIVNVFDGAISLKPKQSEAAVVVPSGYQGRFDHQDAEMTYQSADPARQAWANGILLANEKPLCDFVNELNRYRNQPIICADDVDHFKLTGAYPLSDMRQILSAVEASIPVHFWQVNHSRWRVDKRR